MVQVLDIDCRRKAAPGCRRAPRAGRRFLPAFPEFAWVFAVRVTVGIPPNPDWRGRFGTCPGYAYPGRMAVNTGIQWKFRKPMLSVAGEPPRLPVRRWVRVPACRAYARRPVCRACGFFLAPQMKKAWRMRQAW